MSGGQLGTYQPPNFSEESSKQRPEKDSDEFNLLDIDFEDFNTNENAERAENQDPEIMEEEDPLAGNGGHSTTSQEFLKSNVPHSEKVQVGKDDDINANSGNQDRKGRGFSTKDGDDLEENTANIVESKKSWTRYFTVDYYKEYFDVSTNEVITRLRKAILPTYHGTIFENGKVDLFGPIWVIITLNVAITVFGNIAKYIKFNTSDDEVQYKTDIKNITQSVPLITFYFI
jgi:hypothetical protein